MADYELDKNGKNIEYMKGGTLNPMDVAGRTATPGTSLDLFLNGGTGSDLRSYPKVDMSLWDQATMCATCHVGGVFYEQDRQGSRLPARLFMDWGPVMAQDMMAQMGVTTPSINPLTTTVWERYNADGTEAAFPTFAPWIMPAFVNNDPTGTPMMAPHGWGPMGNWTSQPLANSHGGIDMIDANTGNMVSLYPGQLMLPNVKEMDCLFCHLKGYDNVMSSVMTMAGNLAFAPAAGAGLMDTMTFGYNANNGKVTFTNVSTSSGRNAMQMVSLASSVVASILPKPDSNNCMQCHATKTLKNFAEMFGTTGTGNGFLSSGPMVYDPAHEYGPNGKRMAAFDVNAVWLPTTSLSPVITYSGLMNGNGWMADLPYPQAQGATPFNSGIGGQPFVDGNVGGGNPGMSGPIYFYSGTNQNDDQAHVKKAVSVFARAEWFKRGDTWQAGQDAHSSFGCAGCHFTDPGKDNTRGGKKNLCDPGRGFDMASGIQDGVPPLKDRNLVTVDQGEGTPTLQTPAKHDTRNTVKRCEFCHITGTDVDGNAINTFGANNPTPVHASHGLTGTNAVHVQMIDKMDMHGNFGGQGTPTTTDAATLQSISGQGDHLDILDCTVCHVQKVSMTVRALDATSGMRFPVVLGTDMSKGMMGLFEDPAPDTFNAGALQQYNGMFTAINTFFNYTGSGNLAARYPAGANGGPGYQPLIPAGTHVVGGKIQEWKPLHLWQKLGNMDLPLTTNLAAGIRADTSNPNIKFRRKIYLSNAISAILWNNTDPNVDANGDGANGGLLIGDNDVDNLPAKGSLIGYRDIFSGDPPNKNNTQGYGDPIFDPWAMHDLKAGFNFAPSALSPISIGFGDPATAPYGTAYMQDGSFTGEWKFASVWSGAVIFTEPDQITKYKDYRTLLACGTTTQCNKGWQGAELAYIGAPFMVTHGVKPVSEYVKGRSCAECHAPGAGFFDGGFNMVGSAIPADRTYNPTSQLAASNMSMPYAYALDANGAGTKVDANGDYVRMAGVPGLDSASTLFSRPLEWIPRVKAKDGDLRTDFEGFNKLGQPRNLKFQTSAGGYTWTTDLSRAEVLYPAEDGKIYCAITDTACANPMDGPAYAAYLMTLAQPANALIKSVDGVTVAATPTQSDLVKTVPVGNTINTVGNDKVAVVVNTAVNLVADTTGNGTTTTYTWRFNDGSDDVTGASASKTFTTPGSVLVTLITQNLAGDTKLDYQFVNVVTPSAALDPATITVTYAQDATDPSKTDVQIATPANMPAYTTMKISWGDGQMDEYTPAQLGATIAHTFKQVGKMPWQTGTALNYNTATGKFDYHSKMYFYNVTPLPTGYNQTALVASKTDQIISVSPLAKLQPSMRVTKYMQNGYYLVKAGTNTAIVITVRNNGALATGATVTVPALPTGVALTTGQTAKVSAGSSFDGTTWTITSLGVGQIAYLTIPVTVSGAANTVIDYALPAGATVAPTGNTVPTAASTVHLKLY